MQSVFRRPTRKVYGKRLRVQLFPVSGGVVKEGSGVGTVTLAGVGVGESIRSGSGAGTVTLGGSGSGESVRYGSGAAAVTLAGVGVGYTSLYGSGVGAATLTGVGVGYTSTFGFGSAAVTLAGQGQGDNGIVATSLTIIPGDGTIIPPPSFTSFWDYTDEIASSGASAPYDLDDASVYDEIGATVVRRGPMVQSPITAPTIVFESLDEAVATVSSSGQVESITTGTTQIICRKRHVKNRVEIATLADEEEDITYLVNYLAGTLGKHAYDEADTLLDVSTQTNIYTSGTTRNPNVWTGAYDITGIMQHNTTGGNNGHRGATLISPRHVYMAGHFPVAVGATITWVKSDNTTVQRTLSAVENLPAVLYQGQITGDLYYRSPDIQIGLLSSDVPSGITFYKILPADWQDYLTLYTNSELPIIVGAQQRRLYQRWWKWLDQATLYGAPAGQEVPAIVHTLADVASAAMIVGDSGQPLFLPVNGELVLLGAHFSSISCDHAATFASYIDAAMTSLGGGYTTESVDLTGFNNYG